MRRLRTLLIAEAANPEWTSVPLEGWSHASALACITDAHVVTQVRNREAIERAGWTHGDQFTAIDSEAVAKPAHYIANKLRGGAGKGWTTVMASQAIAYPYFERLVWKKFGADIKRGKFDVVHRLTPLSPTIPSSLARHCKQAGVPFVWGPINGGVPWPRGFDSIRRRENEWLSYVRGLYRAMPGYRSTRNNVNAIIVGSMDTWKQLPSKYHSKSVYIAENAVDPDLFVDRVDHSHTGALRVGFIGRLVPYKGADILIEAAAPLVRSGRIEIDILGDGPQMPFLRNLIRSEALSDQIRLLGNIKHAEIGRILSRCSVLGFPSIREFGGAVVLEAMSLEMVPIVVKYGGPGELVNSRTGFTIPIGTRDSIVRALREHLSRLSNDPSTLPTIGRSARERVTSLYTWPQKAKQVVEVYRWVIGDRPDKPSFGFFDDDG